MTKELVLPPETRDAVLKHLKRAGHDRLGESHVVYPEPGAWDIEQDEPGCSHGLWLVDDESKIDEADAPRTQCDVCTCGYNDVLNLLESGHDEERIA